MKDIITQLKNVEDSIFSDEGATVRYKNMSYNVSISFNSFCITCLDKPSLKLELTCITATNNFIYCVNNSFDDFLAEVNFSGTDKLVIIAKAICLLYNSDLFEFNREFMRHSEIPEIVFDVSELILYPERTLYCMNGDYEDLKVYGLYNVHEDKRLVGYRISTYYFDYNKPDILQRHLYDISLDVLKDIRVPTRIFLACIKVSETKIMEIKEVRNLYKNTSIYEITSLDEFCKKCDEWGEDYGRHIVEK